MDNLDIKLNKNEYEELKKWCKQANINAWRQVIGYFVLLEIIWGVVIYIAYLQQGNIHSKSLILFLAAIFISGLFIAITGYFFSSINKEKIKKECIEELEKADESNYELPMFPIRKLDKLGIRYFLSNRYIVRGFAMMIIIFIGFFIMEYNQGRQDAENLKNRISITKINNNNYSVIIHDTDSFIAERIEINDKDAIVYVNEQIIVPKDNIEITVRSFDSISRA